MRAALAVAFAALLGIAAPAAAQNSGRIVGRVIDGGTGRGIAGAQVSVGGTTLRATAGVDGRYTLAGVPAGVHTVGASHLGFSPKSVTGVNVAPGAAADLDISLNASTLSLTGITVTAVREAGTVNRALDEQRTSTGVVNSTTSEQIARSPDSDAAQAVQRVSGVTVSEGKFVVVRGLGERYTTTSLNGARIPSPEPEKRVVPLDLFPSSLLESITTSKTFTPDQPGDFSGASVNLRTRSFPARRTLTLSLGGGLVQSATGSSVQAVPGAGNEWFGTAAGGRSLPGLVRAAGDFRGLTQQSMNQVGRSFRNQWAPTTADGLPNGSASLSLGGEDALLGQRIGYVGSATYSRSQEVRLDETRARAVANPDFRARTYDAFQGSSGVNSVLWGGMLNLSTFLGGADHKIELNNSYNRSADNDAYVGVGTLEQFSNIDNVQRTSLRYTERSVLSNQLRGTHQLLGATVEWAGTASRVTRDEPDRVDLLYGQEQNPAGGTLPMAWLGYLPDGARRTFSELDETARSGTLDLRMPALGGTLRFGGLGRRVERSASARSYNMSNTARLTVEQRAASPEEIFDGRYFQGSDAYIIIAPTTNGGSYGADEQVAAGYAMVEMPVSGALSLVGGARVERWDLDVDAERTDGERVPVSRRNTDVLPSLALNARLSDVQNLRLSVSQTLSRPEYRELAEISYRDLVNNQEVVGNAGLVRALIQNYDLRWEMYPGSGEVLSLGVFAKRFRNPIEQIEIATSGGNQLSYTNAESALNYGVELEARTALGDLVSALEPFAVSLNATLMKSRISTGNDPRSAATRDDRAMVGQAPYVINAGLSYTRGERGATSATLLYNVVGKRLVAAALTPLLDDPYEQPRQMLDFSLRTPLRGGVSLKVDAENLLDAPVEWKQGEVTRLRYRTGRTVGFGISWNP
ncbi:MAG TPA: TonB-dependent receptor [Longimicrobium sp.]|uniref:TonB-dependent receptor n=1 Tax=Longimicrobium sp. TaxID=2029185 RepID=UPI002ED8A40E